MCIITLLSCFVKNNTPSQAYYKESLHHESSLIQTYLEHIFNFHCSVKFHATLVCTVFTLVPGIVAFSLYRIASRSCGGRNISFDHASVLVRLKTNEIALFLRTNRGLTKWEYGVVFFTNTSSQSLLSSWNRTNKNQIFKKCGCE